MKWLTKSDYLKFLIHPAYLWLAKYDKEKLSPFDESGQFNVDQGNEVESYARELFPSGVLIDVPLFDKADATAEMLRQAQHDVLFQASVLTDRKLFASADVMVKNGALRQAQGVNTWDLYEIKSSAAVKFDHINDLAFQKIAFEEAGYPIAGLFVIHINSHYTRHGEVEPKKLFKTEEVTDQVEAIIEATRDKIDQAVEVIKLKDYPSDNPTLATNLPAWLPTYRLLHPEQPKDSIYNLKRVTPAQLQTFDEAGITRTSQIPVSFKLSGDQRAYLEALLLNRPAIHHGKIDQWLASLQFPLYFLDYETYNTAIPLWDGQRPYQQLPFQYSLHILDKPGGNLTQREFLARGQHDPIEPLLTRLEADLGPSGSILVWYKDFEMGCNDRMAALHPQFADFLAAVNERIEDLMEVFSNHWYVDPGFGGSNSIKNVLPVLVPEMSYAGLNINKGDLAQVRWTRAAKGELSSAEAEQIYADLVEYCGQDTLAMVKIYEVLINIKQASATSG